jgi:Fic family protein
MIKILAPEAVKPHLHRINRIKTIQGTLEIEGNSLSIDQVTAVLDGKRVLAQPRELQEVRNAFTVYDAMNQWAYYSLDDLLTAHDLMMAGLVDEPGCFRSGNVGVHGAEGVIHVAPPPERIIYLVEQLLDWLKQTEEHPLIAGSVFHYELEFIHPFQDGNGRMGRLWQTLILMGWNPIFMVLPLESMIRDHRSSYYEALNTCNQAGESTEFIAFVLEMIQAVLAEYAQTEHVSEHVTEQVERLLLIIGAGACSAKELMGGLKLTHRPTFLYTYLQPALKAGLIEMTRPDAPRARNQKYRITPTGIHRKRNLQKEVPLGRTE